jgi:hypothetical protein
MMPSYEKVKHHVFVRVVVVDLVRVAFVVVGTAVLRAEGDGDQRVYLRGVRDLVPVGSSKGAGRHAHLTPNQLTRESMVLVRWERRTLVFQRARNAAVEGIASIVNFWVGIAVYKS